MIMQVLSQSAPRYGIDLTGPLEAPMGLLKLSGWIAGWADARVEVRLCLGSAGTRFDCVTHVPRDDVAAAHPELAGAAEAGFSLETYVPPGFHIGTLEYRLVGRDMWVPFHTLSINAGLGPLFAALESEPPAENTASWRARGWCFHPQCNVDAVWLHFAESETPLRYGESRADVAATYSWAGTAMGSGFSGEVALPPGRSPVALKVRLSNGSILQHPLLAELNVRDLWLEQAQLVHLRQRAAQIPLKAIAVPEVSIVIPIFNQLEFTLSCLESLARHAGPTSFEVIVIDDKSSAPVAEVLSAVNGLRLHSNEKNQGFVLNCNRGAEMARGEYVLFLNNDTEVQSGWLEAMRNVFRQRPNAGAVGAKLIYPDGRLQEAGGIIGEDGSGWNYGKGDDPDRPEYDYLRQADYCSGACLMLPRELFQRLGGFDTRYCPAYYEDTDLAFAVRAAGREVYYQPAARIVHFEGVSSGTDIKTGVKRHQVLNREKFAAKWEKELAGYTADPGLIELARDRHTPCRVLVIDACALTPDGDSGSLRMFNLLLMLARHGAKVTFVAANLQSYEPFSTRLRLEGVEHLGVPHIFNLSQYLETHAYAFDVIVLSRKSVASEFIDVARKAAPNARLIFDTVDLIYLRLERQAELERSTSLRADAAESKRVELALCEKADLVFVVSPIEAELLAAQIPPAKIALVSNIHEIYTNTVSFAERQGLMFVGGFQHPPNVDAVVFFLDEVLPLLRKRLPEIEVHIVGTNMPAALKNRAEPRVHMHGFVPDLNPLYARVRLCIAPLRYGAGVKGKVNQSMAHGVPVVATSPAVEGMHLRDDHDVLVADTAAEFANAAARLHENEALWHKIRNEGLENIRNHFSFSAVEQELFGALGRELFRRSGVQRPLPRRPAASYQPGDKLSFGNSGSAKLYMREGWAAPEESSCWISGKRASMDFALPPDAALVKIRALVYPFLAPPALSTQRLQVLQPGNTEPIEFVISAPARPVEIEWQHDSRHSPSSCLSVTFLCPDAIAPSQLSASNDVRKLSFAFIEMTITSLPE